MDADLEDFNEETRALLLEDDEYLKTQKQSEIDKYQQEKEDRSF